METRTFEKDGWFKIDSGYEMTYEQFKYMSSFKNLKFEGLSSTTNARRNISRSLASEIIDFAKSNSSTSVIVKIN
jgi:hypothetical protein